MSQMLNPATEGMNAPPAQGPWRAEMRALLAIGVPMGLTQLIQFSVNTIDVLMIGRLGPTPLAASSLGLVMFYAMFLIGLGPAMAVSPMVSQALGARGDDHDDVRISVRMGLWVSLATFLPAVLLALFSRQIILALGQPAELAALAEPYVIALAPGLPFMLGVVILRNFLAAIDRARAPLIAIIFTTAFNGVMNWLLIYGNAGMPRLELVGAGIASSLAHFAGFAALSAYVYWDRRARAFDLFRDWRRAVWDRFAEIIRLGWPIGLSIAFEALLFNCAVFLMGRIGVNEVAAYQVALNVAALAFMMPLGLSMAGGVRVGLARGAGDAAGVRRASLITIGVCIAAIMLFAIPMLAAPHYIASLYLDADDPGARAVIALVASFLPIAAAFALFDATQVAAMQCLRGLKDVRVPMAIAGIAYWLIGFPAAAWLGLGTSLGAVGVWWGLLIALATAAALLSARLYAITR